MTATRSSLDELHLSPDVQGDHEIESTQGIAGNIAAKRPTQCSSRSRRQRAGLPDRRRLQQHLHRVFSYVITAWTHLLVQVL